ncbi:hypothetical protein BDZ45DRAFT_748245 [Acephala macrosclerotiorum]|nr:hypothetical protein BDZ45DRAFT_748245 [Acephala macrosclerotiorum]
MHRFSKLWYLAVLIALAKAQFNLFDQPLCQSIYITIFDGGSPPAETYVLSSETYQLAPPPCPTYGPEPPKIDGDTTIKLPSYSNFRNPPKVTTPPVVPTLPFANSLPRSQNPPPTPHITISFPLLNNTIMKIVQTIVSTQVLVPAVPSEAVSEPAAASTFQPLISATLPSPAMSSTVPIPLPSFPVCGSLVVPAGAFGLNEPAITAAQIYHGIGYTENQNNPGNPGNNPPIVGSAYNMNLQTSVQEACLVVEMCVLFGFIHSLSSIDLHLVELSGNQVEWVCVGYPEIVGSGDFFTVQNTSVILALSDFITCLGWTSGGIPAECCSQYGFCGSADIYCGANCQPEFGICGILSLSSSLPPVTPTSIIEAPTQSPPPISLSLPPLAASSTANAPAQSPSPISVGCTAAPASPAQYNCGASYAETGSYSYTWDQLFFGSCAT